MPKTKQVVLSNAKVLCPCCGYALIVGATVRLKATREMQQTPLKDYDAINEVTRQMAEADICNEAAAERYEMREEAERHG